MTASTESDSFSALRTRRDFMRGTMLGAAAAWTMPGFIASTISSLQAQAAGQASPATGRDSRILVILQLAGGNDGLNTVVPYADDIYHRSRPGIAIPAAHIHKLNDDCGLAPALGGLRKIYDEGHLAVVQGVGYPNPNRSHFRSTEIWQCAMDADKVSRTGWLGRYFDNACAGAPNPTIGVSLSDQAPQSFAAVHNPGIALSSPELFRWMHGRDEDLEEAFESLALGDDGDMMNGASISMLPGGTKTSGAPAESPLSFLERTAMNAQVSSEKVRAVAQKSGRDSGPYPGGSRLAERLKLVAQMIAGGLPARVYYVSHGGFDTHNGQGGEGGAHQRLLRQMDEALAAFVADLKARGLFGQVAVMTFSEFGRRLRENGSGGTDHGTAAPLFMLGGGIKGGLHGRAPSLADLDDGDLRHTTDFRSVYATVLEGWLGTDAAAVLGRRFPALPLLG